MRDGKIRQKKNNNEINRDEIKRKENTRYIHTTDSQRYRQMI